MQDWRGTLRHALLAGIASSVLAGCSTVAPWARGTLAKPHMALDPDPLRRELEEHVNSSREATSGSGRSAGGGGCGCT